MNYFVYLCATGLFCVASEVVLFVAVDLVSYTRDHHHPKRKHHHYPSEHNFKLLSMHYKHEGLAHQLHRTKQEAKKDRCSSPQC